MRQNRKAPDRKINARGTLTVDPGLVENPVKDPALDPGRLGVREALKDFIVFGLKELQCCIFAGSFFILLFISRHLPLGDFPRYDFLFLAALGLQAVLVAVRLETPGEALGISIFHLVGLVLELFKTSPGVASWSYPEPCNLRLFTVPLYAGFMYAAVGSYLIQSWKVMKLEFRPFPPVWQSLGVCILIYLNFFTNHWIVDLRPVLAVLVVLVYARTRVYFTVTARVYRMPVLLSFGLIAFFIWLAENMATFLGAWSYPDQTERWNPVSFSKISSWALLVIISFIIVALIRQKKDPGSLSG